MNGSTMTYVYEFLLFAAKTVFFTGAIVMVVGFLFYLGASRSRSTSSRLEIEKLNVRFKNIRSLLLSQLLDKKQFKKWMKSDKKEKKREATSLPRPRVFVLDFDGDIRATAAESLREEVTAVLSVASDNDEVVLRLESGGGLVTSYGLAASQLTRLHSAKVKIKLTICVDKIAASGGYMMACVGDRILAAPFAVLGSIGVIAQVPNFNKLLKKVDIDFREVTAGEYKRTVTMFGEITEPGLRKFKEQIQDTHQLFKNFVIQQRPKVDLERVATGEYWYGTQALELGLVDEILTSDEYILQRSEEADTYQISFRQPKNMLTRLQSAVSNSAAAISRAVLKALLTQTRDTSSTETHPASGIRV